MVRVDITLTVGSISEEVVVTAAVPLIESETSSLGQVIGQSQVHDLPLDGRDFVELAYLTPGVNRDQAPATPCSRVEYRRISGAMHPFR